MPWQKRFDPDSALEKAMRTFWARGYDATSVADLVDAMGVNRGSIYATFGDKHSLFVKALRRYDAVHRAAWTAALAERMAPREAILAVFDDAIAATLEDGSRDGCLLVNSALELSPHDEEVAAIVAEAMTGMETFLRTMIERGQHAGDIPAHVPPDRTAAALLSLFIGLRVLARSRPEAPLLRAVADRAAAMLA